MSNLRGHSATSRTPWAIETFMQELAGQQDFTLDVAKAALKKKPYFLTLKRGDPLYSVSYTQGQTDFTHLMCRECRGVILDSQTHQIVAAGFTKFFNYGEELADDIDWSTARVQEKLDGSLVKVYFWNGQWRVASNNCADARDATLCMIDNRPFTVYDMFCEAKPDFPYDLLNRQYCYMFEVMHPKGGSVVRHTEPRLVHLGTRDMSTMQEVEAVVNGIDRPRQYEIRDLDQAIRESNQLDAETRLDENGREYILHEGFVVVDGHYRRIKIKSKQYLNHHLLKNQCSMELKEDDLLRMMVLQSTDDLPLNEGQLRTVAEMKQVYVKMLENLTSSFVLLRHRVSNRGEFVKQVQAQEWPIAAFGLYMKVFGVCEKNQKGEVQVEMVQEYFDDAFKKTTDLYRVYLTLKDVDFRVV